MRVQITTLLSSLLLASVAVSAQAETATEVCAEIDRKSQVAAEQFPIDIDNITRWIGLSADYQNDECHLGLAFSINTEALAIELAEVKGKSKEDVLSLFKSEVLGEETLKDFLNPPAQSTATGLLGEYGYPAGVKVEVSYTFDDPAIAEVIIIGADTTE